MKMSFKRFAAWTAALTAMGLTIGLSAYAQMPPDGGPWGGARFEQHRAQMAKFHEKRLAALKTKLKLEANQEAAWNAFAQAHQPPNDGFRPHPDRETMSKLRTPERLDEMQKQFDTHHTSMQTHMKQMVEATRQFYAQLSPEQQKVFDKETLPPKFGPHDGHEREGRHPAH